MHIKIYHIRQLRTWVNVIRFKRHHIGHSYYFAVRGFCSAKMQVGLCEPKLIKKKDSVGLAIMVKDTVGLCVEHLTTTTLKKSVNHKWFTTREYDILLHQRLGVRI